MAQDSIFGVHEQALRVRSARAEMLAANLVNADTPNFKARDLDFKAILARTQDHSGSPAESQAGSMVRTNAAHLNGSGGAHGVGEVLYRNPLHASLDGNTVDTQVEQAEFARNAIQYQATVTFITDRVRSLMTAIRGD